MYPFVHSATGSTGTGATWQKYARVTQRATAELLPLLLLPTISHCLAPLSSYAILSKLQEVFRSTQNCV